MSIETSPKWVQEQVRKGFDIGSRTPTRTAIDALSKETLIAFFGNYDNTPFLKNAGPKNSAAYIIAYQKSLNMLGASLDTDGVWGEKTRSELEKFQKKEGLKGKNGIPGPETVEALKNALQKSLPKEEIIEDMRLQKAKNYLIKEEKYTENKDGIFTNPAGDYAITIKDGVASGKSVPDNKLSIGNARNAYILGKVDEHLSVKK